MVKGLTTDKDFYQGFNAIRDMDADPYATKNKLGRMEDFNEREADLVRHLMYDIPYLQLGFIPEGFMPSFIKNIKKHSNFVDFIESFTQTNIRNQLEPDSNQIYQLTLKYFDIIDSAITDERIQINGVRGNRQYVFDLINGIKNKSRNLEGSDNSTQQIGRGFENTNTPQHFEMYVVMDDILNVIKKYNLQDEYVEVVDEVSIKLLESLEQEIRQEVENLYKNTAKNILELYRPHLTEDQLDDLVFALDMEYGTSDISDSITETINVIVE